jgi:peptidoglycan-N-acetylglucosamine deacetylase
MWTLSICVVAGIVTCVPCVAQSRTVALTFDDLPAVRAVDGRDAAQINRAILAALEKHHAPATGFVIEKSIQEFGEEAGREILRGWTRRGHDLGNHTFSHADLNDLTFDQFQAEAIRGEASLGQAPSKAPRYLRFPFNHTGDTREKVDAVKAFLAGRHYEIAVCTIDTSDYEFARAYDVMRDRRDTASMNKLRAEYLTFTAAEIDYYGRLHQQVFGRETSQVMLLHANHLNADVLEQILRLFEERKYRFVALEKAQSDPAYGTPDTWVTKSGPMWGYRWARALGVKVDGKLEPEPPAWVIDFGKRLATGGFSEPPQTGTAPPPPIPAPVPPR